MKAEEEWNGATLTELSREWAERVIFLPDCGSTNDEARHLALRGAKGLTVVIAERQRAGRGRRGQPWSCPPGQGLAFSLIVRPTEAMALWPRMALAAGLAVAEGLEDFGVATGLKWPNDVWVAGKKISGILVESGADFVVVGVGVNVNVREFPEDLSFPATSLALELGRPVSREELLVACLRRLPPRLGQIGKEFPDLLKTWSERCVLTGKSVTMEAGESVRTGRVEGISAQGELLLRGEAGVERIRQASEIREL